MLVLTRLPIDSLEALADKQLAYTGDLQGVVDRQLRHVTPMFSPNHTASGSKLCDGSADAMLTDRILLDRFLLARPAGCTAALHVLGMPGATLDLAILAKFEARDLAERLRLRIGQLEADGTVAAIALRYPSISAASAGFIANVMQTEQQYRVLRTVLILLSILLIISAALLYRLFREARRQKRTEEALRRSNKELAQFNYAANHDLAEPIRNMSLYSELLQRECSELLHESSRGYLGVIRDGAQKMLGLQDSLRKYTELLNRDDKPRNLDAQEVFREARLKLQSRISQTGAAIEVDSLPPVSFDRSQLLEVFENLITNALTYRSAATPRIRVSAHKRGGEYVFSVQDNGIGIAAQYHTKIFDVFKRLHGSDIPGAGMGLAITKKIVESNGGRIWVESELGRGATFSFTIPATGSRRAVPANSTS